MKGMGLRKIRSEWLKKSIHISWKDNWKGGETLRRMKAETECRIVVADNGRMWIDGELDGILDVRNRLSEISRDSRGGRN